MDRISCTHCGEYNPSNLKYCSNCGYELPKVIENLEAETDIIYAHTPTQKLVILLLILSASLTYIYFTITDYYFSLKFIPEIRFYNSLIACPILILIGIFFIFKIESKLKNNWRRAIRICGYSVWLVSALYLMSLCVLGNALFGPSYSATIHGTKYYLYRDCWEPEENTITITKRHYLFEREKTEFHYFHLIHNPDSLYQSMIEEQYGSDSIMKKY